MAVKRLQLATISIEPLASCAPIPNLTIPELAQIMLVTPLGMARLVKLEQKAKASLPMVVTPAPMLTLVRLPQYSNAPLPMLVTLLGIENPVKPEHELKA